MPSKRKRAENTAEAPSRVTRSTSSAARMASTKDATGATPIADPTATTNVRNSKRAKMGATGKTTSTKKGQEKLKGGLSKAQLKANSRTATSSNDDNDLEPRKQETPKEKHETMLRSRPTIVPLVAKYDPKQSLALFAGYAESDNPDVIGPAGFEKICNDAQIPMEGAMALILSWQLRAQEMAKLSKEAWIRETDTLKASSLLQLNLVVRDLNDLLILGHPAVQRPASKSSKESSEPYDRTRYWTYVKNPKAAFQELYIFCFLMAKPEQSRNIDMDTAMALWSVLLVPSYPLMSDVLAFMTEQGTYKAANKDLWNMMLEFCQSVDANLRGYDSDAAWPTLLDDFVTWKKSKVS